MTIDLASGLTFALIHGRTAAEDDEHSVLRANDLCLVGRQLVADGRWEKHPNRLPEDAAVTARAVRSSWNRDIRFAKEIRDAAGEVRMPGLRTPQIGALHALAAHWTSSDSPALVVLPTGTGKTEVMLAASVMRRPKRVLVLVPSDALRTQTVNKYVELGVLKRAGVVDEAHRLPVVGLLARAPISSEDRQWLDQANVVVSTVSMIQRLHDEALDAFIGFFDTVFFDEAHHVPALSWDRIYTRLSKCTVVGFTATPFRLDGERVPGKLVYQFPLRMAQAQNYFKPIDFIAVDETEVADADVKIARLAIERLRSDRAAGYQHILLARAATKKRAESLYRELYSVMAPDLAPALIYSGIKNRAALLAGIKRGHHAIIVCVDMFGEGFDLPALKIAALHDIHRSLAITLQFTGRFTRSETQLGSATLVANLADQRVQEAIEDLYGEDADWNELIPELSARAIAGHIEVSEFIERMQPSTETHGPFDLGMLRPKTSAVMYKVERFSPRRFASGLRRTARVHRVWTSRERDTCVFITQTPIQIDWASVKEVSDEIWDIFVLFYDRSTKVLFIHSSQTNSLHLSVARAVSGSSARLINGERMFRAFAGVQRLVFHNVGLYGRGKLRFRMYTGFDVSEAIAPPAQVGSTKSNAFAVGYVNGRSTTVGASFKGRVWSMTSSTIPEWIVWCRQAAAKILDERLPTNAFLAHTLVPREIAALPDASIFTILPPDEWFTGDEDAIRIYAGTRQCFTTDIAIGSWTRISNHGVALTLRFSEDLSGDFEAHWGADRFQVSYVAGTPAVIRAREGDLRLEDYLSENVPILLLADGSEIRGSYLLTHPSTLPLQFVPADIRTLDWAGIPIREESKWRHGQRREASVQGRLLEERLAAENAFVIDDDDTGEAADVIEIVQGEHDLVIRLFHCKYAHGEQPGVRVSDLYEVCGQAVRSSRFTRDPDTLFRHIERRETQAAGGRPTRFEKGSLKELRKLRRRIGRYRCRFEVAIVQPGLQRSALTPEAASVLAAADMYIREFTGTPLAVYASP